MTRKGTPSPTPSAGEAVDDGTRPDFRIDLNLGAINRNAISHAPNSAAIIILKIMEKFTTSIRIKGRSTMLGVGQPTHGIKK